MAVIDRVLLDRPRWTAIRGEVQRAFNARLKAHDLNASAWKIGENPVDRLLGEELCVLAWAVEHMEMEKIPVAVRNWLAFRPVAPSAAKYIRSPSVPVPPSCATVQVGNIFCLGTLELL